MSYNKQELPRYVETAGKITILTALSGVLIFAFVFIFNIGSTELQKAVAAAGTATTTLTVLNTPPVWNVGEEGREEFQSSTSTPTNSGSQVSWIGRATDANGAPYFMIICSTNATPTAGFSTTTLGTVPPVCAAGTRFAVSTSTVSGQQARAATTTTEIAPFAESNNWFAWVCDDDPVNPRCSTTYSTGTTASNSSPFNVNRRPIFTAFGNNGPVNPGGSLLFTSSSSDPDVVDAQDFIYLTVCRAATFSTTTKLCGAANVDFLASTTIPTLLNANATYTLPAIAQDAAYNAFGYIYDQHGHTAIGSTQGATSTFSVNNVAPTITNISLNGGLNMTLSVEAGQTTGFPLSFTANDANSCDAVGGGNADEITRSVVAVLRSGIGTSTCNGTPGSYDPNNCYPSGVATSTWNLTCTASTTSCLPGGADATMDFNCTFPIWFIADPTDGTAADTPFYAQHWVAGVAGVDNNNATGSMATSSVAVDMISYSAISLLTDQITYTNLEPGTQMPTLISSTTVRAVGNTGMNQLLGGDHMCGTYSPSNPCTLGAGTSTIDRLNQKFATSAVAYATGVTLTATTSPTLLDIRIAKPTSTSTPSTKKTYWGIAVPGTIVLSGNYTGQNVFTGTRSATNTW